MTDNRAITLSRASSAYIHGVLQEGLATYFCTFHHVPVYGTDFRLSCCLVFCCLYYCRMLLFESDSRRILSLIYCYCYYSGSPCNIMFVVLSFNLRMFCRINIHKPEFSLDCSYADALYILCCICRSRSMTVASSVLPRH